LAEFYFKGARNKENGARKGIYFYRSLTAPLSFFPRRGTGGEASCKNYDKMIGLKGR
jgi:hypothetical protein